jgi:hypothetical protein
MADSKRFLLRLDPRLFEVIRRWADDDLRSINAQIEYLLAEQARRAGRLPHRRTRPHLPDTAEPEDADGSADRGSDHPNRGRRVTPSPSATE